MSLLVLPPSRRVENRHVDAATQHAPRVER